MANEVVIVSAVRTAIGSFQGTLKDAREGFSLGDKKLVDTMIHDGLWCAFNHYHMGVTAENLCDAYGISREEQNAFAARSQQRAEDAMANGKFDEEIVPVDLPLANGELLVFDYDEFPRAGVTKESLSKLRPAFKQDGSVTAANASGINDGAAAVVVMSKAKAQELGLKPMVQITANASAGVDPSIMGIGPVFAVKKVLAKTNMLLEDVDFT